jgi:hypothetical protein
MASWAAGHDPTHLADPSVRMRRAGRPVVSSQETASSPATIAAVEAAFATAHEGAATLAVRQGPSAGAPVRGSTMWWSTPSPRRHRRRVVDDVAIAPCNRRTT